jgi:hypothetical protein
MQQKHRMVVVVPFHLDCKSILLSSTSENGFGFIYGPEHKGESPVNAATRVFCNTTGAYVSKDELDRFHITEGSEYIVHWYTTRIDFAQLHSMSANTILGRLHLIEIRGWMLPDYLEHHPSGTKEHAEVRPPPDMEYIVPMARHSILARCQNESL